MNIALALAAALTLTAVRSSAAPLAARPMSAQGFARVQGFLNSPLGSQALASPDMAALSSLSGVSSPSPELLAALGVMNNPVMRGALEAIQSGAIDDSGAAVKKFREAYLYSEARAKDAQEDIIQDALDSGDLGRLEAAAETLKSYEIWGGAAEVRRRAFLAAVRTAKALDDFKQAQYVYGEQLIAAQSGGAAAESGLKPHAPAEKASSARAGKINEAIQDVANAPLELKAKARQFFSADASYIPGGYLNAAIVILGAGALTMIGIGAFVEQLTGVAVGIVSIAAGMGAMILGIRRPDAAPRPSFRSQLAHFMDSSANPEIAKGHAKAAWTTLLAGSMPMLVLPMLGLVGTAGVVAMILGLTVASFPMAHSIAAGKPATRNSLATAFGFAALGLSVGAALGASPLLTLPMAAGWALGLLTAIGGAPSGARSFPRFRLAEGLKGAAGVALLGAITYSAVPFGLLGFAFFGAWAGLGFLMTMR